MVELMIGLVAVLACFAALVQFVSLNRAHHATLTAARRTAGELALRDTGPGTGQISDADYIKDWSPGPDGKRHTRDDTHTTGNAGAFSDRIVGQSVADGSEWDVLQRAPGDAVSPLFGQPNPSALFGLVSAGDRETVPVLPAVRSLLYRADSIEVESEVWMTWTRGIY